MAVDEALYLGTVRRDELEPQAVVALAQLLERSCVSCGSRPVSTLNTRTSGRMRAAMSIKTQPST